MRERGGERGEKERQGREKGETGTGERERQERERGRERGGRERGERDLLGSPPLVVPSFGVSTTSVTPLAPFTPNRLSGGRV